MPRNVEQSETKKQQLDNEDEEIIGLSKDTIIDRFGHNYGYYFGDPSSSFDNRSLSLLKPNKNPSPHLLCLA